MCSIGHFLYACVSIYIRPYNHLDKYPTGYQDFGSSVLLAFGLLAYRLRTSGNWTSSLRTFSHLDLSDHLEFGLLAFDLLTLGLMAFRLLNFWPLDFRSLDFYQLP